MCRLLSSPLCLPLRRAHLGNFLDSLTPPPYPSSLVHSLQHWIIMNGTLYCNYEDYPQQFWIGNFSAYKAQADARWTKYYGGLRGSGPMNDACFAADGNTCRKECGYCGPSSNSSR